MNQMEMLGFQQRAYQLVEGSGIKREGTEEKLDEQFNGFEM